ncbi:MAG TPA: photosynthetic reaction center cytochrome c subunit family protein [Blastocatellia bacterium]|nr:photosynthetic reaction center cytochrome c subunit family protein [Blastocatellia bacterium]
MSKDDIRFAIIGIVGGIVLGFLVANWTTPSSTIAQKTDGNANQQPRSVNAPPEADLPPNHPPVNPGETVPAGPLPSGSEGAAGSARAASSPRSGESVSLPSLEPLPASSKEERAEKKYKNIQLFKGLPADRIESIMFAFKDSLGVECTYCHVKDQFEKDDKTAKQTARKMISLVRDANAKLGSPRVSCFTCHRGQPRPVE